MAKVSTNISLDADLKRSSQELFFRSWHGSLHRSHHLSEAGSPRSGPAVPCLAEMPNAETAAALNEYSAMKTHPENYPRYASFHDAMNEVLSNA